MAMSLAGPVMAETPLPFDVDGSYELCVPA